MTMAPSSFPATPIAGCIHLLDASLAQRGVPGLTPEQSDALARCLISPEAFIDAFPEVDAQHRDAAFGLYLSHLQGGFSPTNARLCFDVLHEVAAHIDAPLDHHDIVPIADGHRGASILYYHRACVTLQARLEPPLAFRLILRPAGGAETLVELTSFQLDEPDGPRRIAELAARHTGLPLA
jgi:hypothetical protein